MFVNPFSQSSDLEGVRAVRATAGHPPSGDAADKARGVRLPVLTILLDHGDPVSPVRNPPDRHLALSAPDLCRVRQTRDESRPAALRRTLSHPLQLSGLPAHRIVLPPAG